MPTILVTGASRGLGLEFVKQFKSEGWKVIATCRNPRDLEELYTSCNVEFCALDVNDIASVEELKKTLGNRPIDVLVNNAGRKDHSDFGSFDYEKFGNMMNTNVFGPLRVAEKLMENVLNSELKQIIFISSIMGSIANAEPNAIQYRTSKAALNMAVRCMSLDPKLTKRGICSIMLHPGHVQTDMGGPNGALTAPESISQMKKQILNFTAEDNGKFLSYDGQSLDW